MRYFADLHIHSRYSRATSRDIAPQTIWKWAQLKGITVIGTGDFTHPEWFKELTTKLEPVGNGLFTLREEYQSDDVPISCRSSVYFVLSTEISSIYKKNGKTRKVHSVVLMPDFESVLRFNAILSRIGNVSSDGRPILGLDAKELLKIVTDTCPEALYIPAHAWTPHFSVFGAESGFDSLEECYEEMTSFIYAIETGLSSNPAMNWRWSALDGLTLLSNSDAHSVSRIGREANIFDAELSFAALTVAVKTKKGFLGTVEFYPEEGKYHFNGHRACKVNLSPEETLKHNYICPVCNKRVTIGVMHRVKKLADRQDDFRPEHARPFYSLIPLTEILSKILGPSEASKKVDVVYKRLLQELGNELGILIDLPLDIVEEAGLPLLKEAISRVRSGNVSIIPGYDGEYGKVEIF